MNRILLATACSLAAGFILIAPLQDMSLPVARATVVNETPRTRGLTLAVLPAQSAGCAVAHVDGGDCPESMRIVP